jgi:hypothetical protein
MQHSFLIQYTTNFPSKLYQQLELDSKELPTVHIECAEYVLVMDVLEEPKTIPKNKQS